MTITPPLNNLPSYVESVTGYPMVLSHTDDIQFLSAVTPALPGQPCHHVVVKHGFSHLMDYIIAYNSAYILRDFGETSSERRSISVTPKGCYHVEKLIKRVPACKGLSSFEIDQYRTHILSGLLIHLRNTPISLRIEEWVERGYPQISGQQRTAVHRTLRDNQLILAHGVQRTNPSETIGVVASLSAAYALFWREKWNNPTIFIPYDELGYRKIAEELLSEYRGASDDPLQDKTLIDAWATKLGVRSWYNWISTDSIGASI